MAVTWRHATLKDFQAVLDIDPDNKIYNGNDYIPAQYHRFLQDPDIKIAVYEKNGKIVAMGMGYIVDDGQTLVSMAGRTHHDTRGQGIWRIVKQRLANLK